MFQVPLVTSVSRLSSLAFWDSVSLYHDRPHLVNRRIQVASQVLFYKVIFSCKGIRHVSELFTKSAILYEMRRLKDLNKEFITGEFVRNIIDCFDKNLQLICMDANAFEEEHCGVFVSVRVLLPRSNHHGKCLEVVVMDKDQNHAIFIAVTEKDKVCLAPPFPYELELSSNSSLRINIQNFEDADTGYSDWLADKLFPKLLKWSEQYGSGAETIQSLSLISVEQYCTKYSELKEKYGAYLIKEWPKKTTTDPQKYVFEDLAIASYLICLWSNSMNSEVNFVDCGCGNGLLVYILNQEGYAGYGIDIRRRPVWEIYPSDVKLEVGTVTPESIFPESTWLIGNHSDELTPWLPVIALKSSPTTNFFVLPCCPYDFSGKKYVRTNTAVSQYSDYLTYVQNISERCGFKTSVDKLRIPSTKRTCLVGVRDTAGSVRDTMIQVEEYIAARMPEVFTPRSKVEQVRNCTQLQKDLIQRILVNCVGILLKDKDIVLKRSGGAWNKGGSVTLGELSKKLDKNDLKQMKNECGGLQTLLRNHRYIFVITNGCVRIREPFDCYSTKKYRSKPCWFLRNHPDGCFYDAEECAYKHVE